MGRGGEVWDPGGGGSVKLEVSGIPNCLENGPNMSVVGDTAGRRKVKAGKSVVKGYFLMAGESGWSKRPIEPGRNKRRCKKNSLSRFGTSHLALKRETARRRTMMRESGIGNGKQGPKELGKAEQLTTCPLCLLTVGGGRWSVTLTSVGSKRGMKGTLRPRPILN